MPRNDKSESLLANDDINSSVPTGAPVMAIPVAQPMDQQRSSQGVANLYPVPAGAAGAAMTADVVVEGKMMRQVNTVRPCRDVAFAAIFLLAVAGAFAAGSVVVGHVHEAGEALVKCDAFKQTEQYKRHSIVPDSGAAEAAAKNGKEAFEDNLPTIIGGLGFVTLVSVLVGVMYLWSLETHARAITWVSCALVPVIQFMLGVWLIANSLQVEEVDKGQCFMGNCQAAGGLIILGSFLWALIVWCKRAQVDLTADLLRMSATAFKDNLTLIFTTGLISMGLSLCVVSPLGVMSIFAVAPDQLTLMYAGCPGCDFSHNQTIGPSFTELETLCEGFVEDDVQMAGGTLSLLGFMAIWVGMLAKEMRIANVGGTIGLHYFDQQMNGANRALTSLKWTLTSNFGSLCFCSLVLTIVEIVERMVEKLREEARRSNQIILRIVMEIVGCCWRQVQAWAEFLTKMAVIGLAITGDPFCKSAKDITTTLIRHNLDGVFVDVFASFTTNMLSLAISIAMGAGGYLAGGADGSIQAIASAIMVGFISFMVLSAIAGIVLVTCNTHYICYVLDLDHNFAPSESTASIHALYKRAIDNRVGTMKAGKGKDWAASGAGKREAAAAGPVA